MKTSIFPPKKIFTLLSIITIAFMVSCSNLSMSVNQPQATSISSPAVGAIGQEIPFVSVARSYRLGSSVMEPALNLVFDSPGLDNLKPLISDRDLSSLQTIDFQKQALLGAFWGVQPAGGYSITIDHVYVSGDELIIAVSLQENDPDFPKIEAITSPYHLVSIEKSLLSDKIQRYQMINADEILASGPIR